MPNDEKRNPTAEEADISKAQAQQQPPQQASQQPETGEQSQPAEFAQGQAADQADEGLQGETATQQRADIEGASQQPKERAEEEAGFIGTEGERDTSSQLVEEEDEDFTPEGK
jgi:hypothetical protein